MFLWKKTSESRNISTVNTIFWGRWIQICIWIFKIQNGSNMADLKYLKCSDLNEISVPRFLGCWIQIWRGIVKNQSDGSKMAEQ